MVDNQSFDDIFGWIQPAHGELVTSMLGVQTRTRKQFVRDFFVTQLCLIVVHGMNSYSCSNCHVSRCNGLLGKAGLLVLLSRYTGGTLRSFPYVRQCALMFANCMVLHGFHRVFLFTSVMLCSQYNHNVMILVGNF